MSRTLTTAMSNALVADVVRPFYLVSMNFDSGETISNLNIWTGLGDLTFESVDFTGLGDLLSISPVEETSDISAKGISVSLTGIKDEFLDVALTHEYQGRPITVRLGAFDDTGSLIADPAIIFSGFMDTMIIAESGEYSTITVSAENKLIAFERTRVRRYTAEDQKIDYPTDKGFEFVTAIVEKQILWGRPTGSSSGGSTGASGVQGGAGNNGSWTAP